MNVFQLSGMKKIADMLVVSSIKDLCLEHLITTCVCLKTLTGKIGLKKREIYAIYTELNLTVNSKVAILIWPLKYLRLYIRVS